jgi:hypothetical protein
MKHHLMPPRGKNKKYSLLVFELSLEQTKAVMKKLGIWGNDKTLSVDTNDKAVRKKQ